MPVLAVVFNGQAASRSSRRPLSPTMMVEPSWPATPSGSGRWPMRSQAARTTMNVAAMVRLAMTRRRARRAKAMTAGMVERSSRVMTASAVSRARSDPARPIATPTVAAVMAGASLTPSPTTITLAPPASSSRTASTLSCGSSPARTSVMPT